MWTKCIPWQIITLRMYRFHCKTEKETAHPHALLIGCDILLILTHLIAMSCLVSTNKLLLARIASHRVWLGVSVELLIAWSHVLISYLQWAWTFPGRGSGVLWGTAGRRNGTCRSGWGVWEGCRGRRWRRCAGSCCGAEYLVIVWDHELHEKSLIAGFQKSDHRHVPRHQGPQERGAKHDAQVSWRHFVVFVLFCHPEEKKVKD